MGEGGDAFLVDFTFHQVSLVNNDGQERPEGVGTEAEKVCLVNNERLRWLMSMDKTLHV